MLQNGAIRNTFKNNLSRLLEEKNATQKELADAIGVSPATVSTWIRGTKLPRMDKADAICRFFSVPRESLFAVESTAPPPRESTHDGARFAAILRQLQADMNRAFDAAVFAALHGEGYTPTGTWEIDRNRIRQESTNSKEGA